MKRTRLGTLIGILILLSNAAQAETVRIGTMTEGTLSHAAGATLAMVLSEQAGIDARLRPGAGEAGLLTAIDRGEIDFGVADVAVSAEGYLGRGRFAGDPLEDLRVTAVLYPLRTALFVRADSGIDSLAELANKRITHGFEAMGTAEVVLDALLANGGLGDGDFGRVPVPTVLEGADRFEDGGADAFFFAVGAEKVAELDASVGVRMLSASDDAAAVERMKRVFPYGYLMPVVPDPAFAGVTERGFALGYDTLLLTGAHVSDALAAEVAEGLAGNKAALAAALGPFAAFDPERMVRNSVPVPYHDGITAWYEAR